MKILILGAGQVGTLLANHLSSGQHQITLIDEDANCLEKILEKLDVRTLTGNGVYPEILAQADAETADLLLAVTGKDETNMLACQIAHTLFNIPYKIARVRAREFITYPDLFHPESLPIDHVISPETIVAKNITRIITHPGTSKVFRLGNGNISMIKTKITLGSAWTNTPFYELQQTLQNEDSKIIAIYRNGKVISAPAIKMLEADDEAYVLVYTNNISKITHATRQFERDYRRIIIAGGGNIGSQIAKALEKEYHVKIIEHNPKKITTLTNFLENVIILEGDVTDKDLLIEENIENCDVFCAVTNKDETNIMAAMLAKRLGAYRVIASISRTTFADMAQGSEIDVVFSPPRSTLGSLLPFVRAGNIHNIHFLGGDQEELIELQVTDHPKDYFLNKTPDQLKLPAALHFCGLYRNGRIYFTDFPAIQPLDHLLFLTTQINAVTELEKLLIPKPCRN